MGILSRDLVCRDAVSLVTDYLDGSLKRRQRRRFESHLKDCPNCSRYLEQIRVTIRLVGHVDPDELDQQARDELIELYRRFKGESHED
jgi:anti-sigma factor RsiW